jgi:hypothetical protein
MSGHCTAGRRASARRLSQLVLLGAALWLSGCAHLIAVQAPVTLPARVPVHVFPSVWVAGGASQEEIYLLDRVASHLSSDRRREVRRLELRELEPARQAGQISGLTCVLLLKLGYREATRSVMNTVPTQYCGIYGCSGIVYETYTSQVPVLVGDATLVVYEGPTARELSRDTFSESVDGGRDEATRYALIERLAETLVRGVDVSLGRESFSLEESGIEQADQGVRALAGGQFKQGRALLEQAVQALGGEKPDKQAKVWHALGVARLFDAQPLAPSEQGFADAERALKLAYQLEPSALHQQSLETLATWHKQQAVLLEQQYAAAHNFELARQNAAARQAPPAPPTPPSEAPEAPPAPPEAIPSAPSVPLAPDAPAVSP